MNRSVVSPGPQNAIQWQSPSGVWARLTVGARYANPTRFEGWVYLGGAVALLLFFVALPDSTHADGIPELSIAVLILAIAWVLGFLALYLGYNRVSQVTVTEREVGHAIGFPCPRHETVLRSDVHAAVVYEGDGTVVLLGESGPLMHARHLDGAAVFAEALGAPTVVWPARAGGDPHLWTLYLAVWLAVSTVPLFFLVLYPGALLGAGVVYSIHLFADLSGPAGGTLAAMLILIIPVVMASILAIPVATFLAVGAGRYLFKTETLNGLLHALPGGSPHWGGRPDPSAGSRRKRLAARYAAWCARVVGIEPSPDPTPDLRGGMKPDAARRALAMAERAL